MNDKAREALVQAALNGVPQIKFSNGNEEGGRCAMGVLIEAFCGRYDCTAANYSTDEFFKWAGMDRIEEREVIIANNEREWDFLTIARKIGNDEESV